MIINVDTICRVKLYLKLQDMFLSYEERKTFLGFETKSAGVYGYYDKVSDEWLVENNRYLENGSVYFKPHVDIHTADGKSKTVWFENESAAKTYFGILQNRIKHIEIE